MYFLGRENGCSK
uniref:SFRICE_004215 n=1 Tax=Spodoptera frugiperda TaxID=7108 RepID=A0A2H1VGP8_SPOFR